MRFDFARTCAADLLTLHDDSRFSINRDIGLHSDSGTHTPNRQAVTRIEYRSD